MTFQEIKNQIEELNTKYSNGSLNISHAEYLKKFKKLKNYNSMSNQVKRFGAKVKKEFAGYYIYQGVNFTVEFNEDECETKWWEVNLFGDNTSNAVFNYYEDYNKFETKKDVVESLLNLDKNWNVNNY